MTQTPAADIVERLRRTEPIGMLSGCCDTVQLVNPDGPAAATEIEALQRKLDEAQADKARLDYLDECSRRLNDHYGTSYGWKLVLNHNVNRLMLGHLEIDLHDSEGSIAKLPSCRAAIDERMLASIRGETE